MAMTLSSLELAQGHQRELAVVVPKEDMMATTTSSVAKRPDQGPAWHTLSIENALRKQGVDAATGLSQAEAETRLKQYGPNKFSAKKKEPGWVAFLNQYRDPMQIVLL